MSKLIVVSDIHGCYYSLMNLLEKSKYNEEEDFLVCIGDYIDRGKNSFEVLEYLIKLQKRVGNDRCVCLLGNHEDMAMNDQESWRIPQNGSSKTRKSLIKNNRRIKDYYWWFKKLPIVYELNDICFCHAGFSYPKLKENTRDELLWGKYALYLSEPTEKQVIFGHYAMKEVYKTPNNNIGIDTGCCFGNKLSSLIIYDDKDKTEIVSVFKDERD